MDTADLIRWLTTDATIYAAIPAAILCYIPMVHQLRRSPWIIALHCIALLLVAVIGTSVLTTRIPYLDATVVLLPFLGLFFVYYATSIRAQVYQSTGIFLMICGFYAIISYGAYLISAAVRLSGSPYYSDHFPYICQLGMIVLLSVPAAVFLKRWGTYLVDHMLGAAVWLLTGTSSIIIFGILSIMAPKLNQVSEMPQFRGIFLYVGLLVSLLYLLSCAFFFVTSASLIQKQELQEQETVYRMQREQYMQLEDQTERMRILRHDFRHALGLLQRLAEENDIKGIREYLSQYENSIPTNTLIHYCESDMVNAILNHYADRAASRQTKTEFLINICELSQDQTFDLISILSNLLENAQQGCDTVPPGDRTIQLKMDVVNDDTLFVVVTNSFDGNVRRLGGRYLSTKRKRGERGIGLKSIERTVSKYNGEVKFYHQGQVFYVDLSMSVERDPAPAE